MNAFDPDAIQAAFALPACDGQFDTAFRDYLAELAGTRPSVVLAFAPKAAGTFLRIAAIDACGGQLVRTVHAQGGRDASFYLPVWLNYYAHGFPSRPLVTHVHMQALPSNIAVIEALDLKPVIMLRPIADMLASYWDMLDADSRSPDNWINQQVPPHYAGMTDAEKGDFLIDMVAPWYVSYFATWFDYHQAAPGRVLVLDYDAFRADPATALESVLAHSRLARPRAECARALDGVWAERDQHRFNRGVGGRGAQRFSAGQMARLKHLLGFYPALAPLAARLIPPP